MISVCDALKRQVEAWRSLDQLMLLDEFVLRNGKPWIAAPYKGARGEAKMCFKNAFDLQAVRPRLLYVEGYALRPDIGLLMHHAWLADPTTQHVVDPTWDRPESCDYFGIPFTRDEALEQVLKSETYGMLGTEMANVDLMWAKDPALKAIFEAKYPCPAKPSAKPSATSRRSSRRSTTTSKSS